MKTIGKFLSTYPAYVAAVLASGFALVSLLFPKFLTPEQFKAIEGFAVLVLLGWVHQSVTPNTKLP